MRTAWSGTNNHALIIAIAMLAGAIQQLGDILAAILRTAHPKRMSLPRARNILSKRIIRQWLLDYAWGVMPIVYVLEGTAHRVATIATILS